MVIQQENCMCFVHFYVISAPHHSTQQEQKRLGLFWRLRQSTSNYNDTLYYNLYYKI